MLIFKSGGKNGAAAFKIAETSRRPLIFPTDTIFGVGAPLASRQANEKIFRFKNRPVGNPFPILTGSLEQAGTIANLEDLTKDQKDFLRSRWPGNFTFLLKSRPEVPEIYKKNGAVALRLPSLDWLREALLLYGGPVTATSVNRSGEEAKNLFPEILSAFGEEISLFISGVAPGGKSSSIYDLTGEDIKKIR